jgi:hypothetical protein
VFSCNQYPDGKYTDKEVAFSRKLAQALGGFLLEKDSGEEMTEDTPIPNTDSYINFWLNLGEWGPMIYVFESGDVYINFNHDKKSPWHYKAADPAQYDQLVNTVSEIREGLDALPLDYQFSVSVSPDNFSPESTALRLKFKNIGKEPVIFSRNFLVEKQVQRVWQPLVEKEPVVTTQEMLTVQPGERSLCR